MSQPSASNRYTKSKRATFRWTTTPTTFHYHSSPVADGYAFDFSWPDERLLTPGQLTTLTNYAQATAIREQKFSHAIASMEAQWDSTIRDLEARAASFIEARGRTRARAAEVDAEAVVNAKVNAAFSIAPAPPSTPPPPPPAPPATASSPLQIDTTTTTTSSPNTAPMTPFSASIHALLSNTAAHYEKTSPTCPDFFSSPNAYPWGNALDSTLT